MAALTTTTHGTDGRSSCLRTTDERIRRKYSIYQPRLFTNTIIDEKNDICSSNQTRHFLSELARATNGNCARRVILRQTDPVPATELASTAVTLPSRLTGAADAREVGFLEIGDLAVAERRGRGASGEHAETRMLT
jgi:hypothetical protein